MIRTVIVGAGGRMGRQLLTLLPGFAPLSLHGAVASARSAVLGRDTGELTGRDASGVQVTGSLAPLLGSAQLVIDFSRAEAVPATLAACAAAGTPLLIGTTGLPAALDAALDAAAQRIALLVAANTSIGVTLLLQLVREAAAALDESYDIEILEVHHGRKLDAPSGTALALARAVAAGRGVKLEAAQAAAGRAGERVRGQIGMAVMRGGDVVGEHEVLFLGSGERVVLRHSATDRAIFARGALAAGRWLAQQRPGRYSMADILTKNI